MFYITAKACRTFTLGEILIMAAMNVETVRLNYTRSRSSDGAGQTRVR